MAKQILFAQCLALCLAGVTACAGVGLNGKTTDNDPLLNVSMTPEGSAEDAQFYIDPSAPALPALASNELIHSQADVSTGAKLLLGSQENLETETKKIEATPVVASATVVASAPVVVKTEQPTIKPVVVPVAQDAVSRKVELRPDLVAGKFGGGALVAKDSERPTRLPGSFVSSGKGPEKRFIKADQLYIRVAADRYSKSVGLLYGGDEVFVTVLGDWAKLDEGQWIRSRWLVKSRPSRFRGGPPAGSEIETSPDQESEADPHENSNSSLKVNASSSMAVQGTP
ncbi:MAG: hypothetical protein NTV34_17325 [Proteobacteria bacterium]|nr:hypothetical protein [Pseudomonadota bacterium]